ncbi:hypothetical protein ACFY4C_18175 [Actinomadura viridis]|uniref:hypothetical protein n=1 Tax=Actinomadura viridis TaxID=58110 RepID=UPI00369F1A2B
MFHNDIMYSVMQERARDLRARGKAARDAGTSRKARRFWADEAAQQDASTEPRTTRTRGTATAAGR